MPLFIMLSPTLLRVVTFLFTGRSGTHVRPLYHLVLTTMEVRGDAPAQTDRAENHS